MAEGSDTGIEGEAILVGEEISYLLGGDLVSELVEGTLSDDDDRLALSKLAVLLFPHVSYCLLDGTVAHAEYETYLLNNAAHFLPPVVLPRLLGNKDEICASSNTCHQS